MGGQMDANRSTKDILTGLIFIAFSLAFGATTLGYELGTPLRMGPGLFPLVLAVLLGIIGVATLVTGLTSGASGSDLGIVPWRAAFLVIGALIFFGVTVKGLGLGPTVFVTVLATALASRRGTPLTSVLLATGLTVFSVVLFVHGLGVTLPTFGPWLM